MANKIINLNPGMAELPIEVPPISLPDSSLDVWHEEGHLGMQGPKGYTGSSSIGYTGSSGAYSAVGYSGSRGDLGYSGSSGFTGSSGFAGSVGYVGSRGYVGSGGAQGSTGAIGYSGSKGIQGNTGYTGSVGFVGSQGLRGYSGSQGIQGYDGSRGSLGYTGSKGDQGVIGFSGSQGVIGFTGSKGSQGIFGYAGSKGDQGSTGFVGSQGTQGNLGYTGSKGIQGFTGSKGDVGLQGATGYTGSKGDLGYTGSIGFTGSQGVVGYVGSKGSQGIFGYAGSKGDQGVVGFVGSQGIQGDLGFTGSIGYTGSKGNQGNTGFIGSQGIQGDLGFTGSIGYTGSKGDQGVVGFVGSRGVIGFTGSQGDIGYTGSVGFVGSQGTIGFTGSQGDIGFTGSQGIQGVIGFTGSQGIQGVIGFTGSKGDQGVIGFTGSQGIQGIIGFTGSKGDIGYTGSVGYVGSKGDQGVIGFTGSKGDQGVIGFTGSKGDQGVIGFTGSKGDLGYTGSVGFVGSQGVIGFTGSQGVIGFTGSQGNLGYSGSVGYAGSQGVIGFTGSKGDQGVIGFTGSQGIQGVIGFTGSKGDLGYTGSVGYVGSQGVIGFTGSQGVIGFTGSKGDIGYTGSVGYVGSAGSGVASVAALTLDTAGTDLSSTVANSTTTPVITLNVPTANASNRGALSSTDWSTFNGKVTSLTVASSNGLAGTSSGGTTPILTLSTSITGVLKGNGTAISAASAGTDYIAPSGDLGTPSAGNLSSCTADGTHPVGYKNIPQITKSADGAPTTGADLTYAGKHIYHTSTAGTFTIPANSSIAYPIGTALTFVNGNGAGNLTIAITTDTMRLAGAGTAGSCTLAANGVATALKISSTEWIISGTGLAQGSAAWSPLALWPLGASSPGLWTDPPYTASLFSTSAGTTAISAIGTVADSANPVGLALDRKGNLALGPELAPQDTSTTTGWNPFATAPATITASVSGIRIYSPAGEYAEFGVIGLSTAKTYLVTFTASKAAGQFQVRGSQDYTYLVGGTYTVRITPKAVGGIFFARLSATTDYTFSAISVREIPGIHLSQATSTSRPVASARKNELLATAVLSTQNVTTTAIPYTISFGGAGTVTASGTHVGALTSGQTFTPTAGTLTLTVAGSVTTAQLERGSAVTSYQRVGATAADYDASAGPTFIRFDGVDDNLASATFAAGTIPGLTDCLIAIRRDSTANAVCGLYQSVADANKVFGIAESGSGSGCVGSGAGTPTVLVDGTQLTGGTAVTRGTLHTALTPGDWHILEFRNLDLSTWTAIGFGLYTSYVLNGGYGGHKVFSNGQDANRDKARAQMAAYFGVTLP